MLRYLVEDGAATGLVLGVLEADGTRRVVSYGNAVLDGRPMDPRAIFEIGSITRTFTATVLADMARRGEVTLDDPVSRYLPEHVSVPARAGREITLRHLATHTSGLSAIGHHPKDVYAPYADLTIEKLYKVLSTAELRDIPGQRYRYSNLGMGLLGHALGRAGRPGRRALFGRAFPSEPPGGGIGRGTITRAKLRRPPGRGTCSTTPRR